ncbi:glycosyltransferase [Paucilactobacillus sp. N302-9]
MKKRILLTGVGDKIGGIESFVSLILKNLHDDFDFSILAATENHVAKEDLFHKYNIKVYYVNNIFGMKNVLNRKETMIKFLQMNKFDIIHINATTLNTEFIAEAADCLNIPSVYHVHNASPSGHSKLSKLITSIMSIFFKRRLNKIDKIKFVSVSKEAADKVFGPRIESEIIVNGIDTEELKFNEQNRKNYREKLSIKDDDKVLIMVARLMPIKNYHKAVNVARMMITNKELNHFFIVGDGPEYNQINNEIRGMRNSIHMLGERTDIAELLSMSDVMILSSFSEGLSISVIEGQAAGLPVVASRGVPEVTNVTNEVAFLNVTEKDEIWSKAIENYLHMSVDRDDMNEIVKNSKFSKKKFIQSIIELYK